MGRRDTEEKAEKVPREKAGDARIRSRRFQGKTGLGGKDLGDNEPSGRKVVEKKLKVE